MDEPCDRFPLPQVKMFKKSVMIRLYRELPMFLMLTAIDAITISDIRNADLSASVGLKIRFFEQQFPRKMWPQ